MKIVYLAPRFTRQHTLANFQIHVVSGNQPHLLFEIRRQRCTLSKSSHLKLKIMHHHLVDLFLLRRIEAHQLRRNGLVDVLDRREAALPQIPQRFNLCAVY